MSPLLKIVAAFLVVALPVAAQVPVPATYQDIFNLLNSQISTFDNTVKSSWNGAAYPVGYSAQLQSANSDLTTQLLAPNFYTNTVLYELNELQALGVTAATFHVNFPTLYAAYYANPSDYQSYVAFYQQLVADIRARGLKVIIESTTSVAYPGTNGGSFASYYQSLTWTQYMANRAQMAANVAQLLHPDYLVVIAEPDTEATATGQTNANTVSGSTALLQGMLTAIAQAGVTGVSVGAGCGTWHPQFAQFIQSFSAQPMQFVDMHVYPVNKGYLTNTLAAADTIHAAGKQATISEMWPYKVRDSELGTISYTDLFARDPFSFWQPVDTSFLQAMSDLANYKQYTFISPFWTHYAYAYLDYAVYGTQTSAQIINASSAASTAANQVGGFTLTGNSYEAMAVRFSDTTAPLVPGSPTAGAVGQVSLSLLWPSDTDNVGVAAYKLYRNGAWLATLNSSPYLDASVQPKTAYTYTIAAVDAMGNASAPSAPLNVTTLAYPDKTPPSVPTGVAAAASSPVQVTLSWTPSTDDTGVIGYQVFRGTSPTNLILFSLASTNSFVDNNAPSTAYYYQITAYDAAYNYSGKSAMVSVTTPADVTPPTTPANLAATAAPGSVVNLTWNASTDNYKVASYKIYRGKSAASLSLLTATMTTSFSDNNVVPNTRYYYAVAAVDVAKNVSPQSAQVSVTAIP